MPLSPLENLLDWLDFWLGGRFCRPPVLFACIPSSLNLSPQSIRIVIKSRAQFIHASREELLYRGPLDQLLANVLARGLPKHDIGGLTNEFAVVAESDGQIGTKIDLDPITLTRKRRCQKPAYCLSDDIRSIPHPVESHEPVQFHQVIFGNPQRDHGTDAGHFELLLSPEMSMGT